MGGAHHEKEKLQEHGDWSVYSPFRNRTSHSPTLWGVATLPQILGAEDEIDRWRLHLT
jgi:hypothetical protein